MSSSHWPWVHTFGDAGRPHYMWPWAIHVVLLVNVSMVLSIRFV